MSIKAVTVRYDDEIDEALALISKLTKVSKNKLIIKAIKTLIGAESHRLAHDMDALSEKLKAYSAKDPHHKEAIAAFVEAELTQDDPAEGTVVVDAPSISDVVGVHLKNG